MKTTIIDYFAENIKQLLNEVDELLYSSLTEIRLRVNMPIILYTHSGEFTITEVGQIKQNISDGYKVQKVDILKTIELVSNFSLYAFENELKNGYITIPGGHRVGICGTTVVDGDRIKTIKNFSGINIRICHQIFDVSKPLINHIVSINENIPKVFHTMIISPPACGKTTMLRDIIRLLSYGVLGKFNGLTVGVVDERSEIAGSYQGIYQNDVGPRTDVLDACPKDLGMIMLLRAMAPKVIAVDELGKENDILALEDIINSGVKVICTVHGNTLDELKKKDTLKYILDKEIFERYIVLGKPSEFGNIKEIYNKKFETIEFCNENMF